MNRIKAILIGTSTGILVGLVNTIIASLSWLILAGWMHIPGYWDQAVTITLLSFCLMQGAFIGGVNGSLCRTLCNLEQVIVSILLSLAVGAVHVLLGGFVNQSLMPVVIYGLALLNGGLIAILFILIAKRLVGRDQRNLRIN